MVGGIGGPVTVSGLRKSSGDEVMGVSSGHMIDIGNYNSIDSTKRNSRLRLRHSNWYEGISSDISFDTNEYSLNNTVDLNKTYIIYNQLIRTSLQFYLRVLQHFSTTFLCSLPSGTRNILGCLLSWTCFDT